MTTNNLAHHIEEGLLSDGLALEYCEEQGRGLEGLEVGGRPSVSSNAGKTKY